MEEEKPKFKIVLLCFNNCDHRDNLNSLLLLMVNWFICFFLVDSIDTYLFILIVLCSTYVFVKNGTMESQILTMDILFFKFFCANVVCIQALILLWPFFICESICHLFIKNYYSWSTRIAQSYQQSSNKVNYIIIHKKRIKMLVVLKTLKTHIPHTHNLIYQ